MKRVAKYAGVEPVLDERVAGGGRRPSRSPSATRGHGGFVGYRSGSGDDSQGTAGDCPRRGADGPHPTPWRRTAPHPAGSTRIQAALQALVDPLTRGDPTSPLRWTCKSRAKLAAALTEQGWRVSLQTVTRYPRHPHGTGGRGGRPRRRGNPRPEPLRRAARHPGANAHPCGRRRPADVALRPLRARGGGFAPLVAGEPEDLSGFVRTHRSGLVLLDLVLPGRRHRVAAASAVQLPIRMRRAG